MISIGKSTKSFKYAFRGIYQLFRNENNAKVHLLASILVIVLGFYFSISSTEWLWLVIAIGLVWITESVNTAIEKLVDLISPGFNPKAGEIKDLAAGAVLIAAGAAVVIGFIVFKNYFFEMV